MITEAFDRQKHNILEDDLLNCITDFVAQNDLCFLHDLSEIEVTSSLKGKLKLQCKKAKRLLTFNATLFYEYGHGELDNITASGQDGLGAAFLRHTLPLLHAQGIQTLALEATLQKGAQYWVGLAKPDNPAALQRDIQKRFQLIEKYLPAPLQNHVNTLIQAYDFEALALLDEKRYMAQIPTSYFDFPQGEIYLQAQANKVFYDEPILIQNLRQTQDNLKMCVLHKYSMGEYLFRGNSWAGTLDLSDPLLYEKLAKRAGINYSSEHVHTRSPGVF